MLRKPWAFTGTHMSTHSMLLCPNSRPLLHRPRNASLHLERPECLTCWAFFVLSSSLPASSSRRPGSWVSPGTSPSQKKFKNAGKTGSMTFLLSTPTIPRRLTLPDKGPPTFRSLHGFCDASSVAYGACIYLNTKYHDVTTHTALVLAKARVLPTKGITIPKAELTAAHLLARLLRHVSSLLGLCIDDVQAWSDSQITLHWLPKSLSDLNRFVANRVAAIQALTPPTIWRYVPSAENPADLASRGVRSADLIASSLWWSGPAWLRLLPDQWPPPFLTKPSTPIYTVSIKPPSTPSPSLLSFISRLTHACSSFFTLVHIVSYVCRFIYNCRHPLEQRKFDSLTLDEITHSKSQLYRLSQLESIPEVFSAAVKKTLLPRGHALRHYALHLLDHGHVLALSRVRNPDAPNQPLELCVLSAKSKLTRLLLLSLHKLYGHPGTSTLLAITASSYVMIGLRNHLKLISRTCVICQKALAQPLNHMMGLLPSVRTTPSPPFHNVGVDFVGPLTLRVGHTRMPSFLKGYVAVFVCRSTKSVHLDLCESLSTQDFMATLHRFVNRRGCPAQIFSDNGSNFVGAREEIRAKVEWGSSVGQLSSCSSCWVSVTRSTSRLLALWKDLPRHRRVTALTIPSSPGWRLVIVLMMRFGPWVAVWRVRLWGGVPPESVQLLGSCSLPWSLGWSGRWAESWVYSPPLVKDESLRSRDWPLATITSLHPGDDGIVRAVTLQCRGRSFQRASNRLVLLVTDAQQEEQELNCPTDEPHSTFPAPGSMSGTQNDSDSQPSPAPPIQSWNWSWWTSYFVSLVYLLYTPSHLLLMLVMLNGSRHSTLFLIQSTSSLMIFMTHVQPNTTFTLLYCIWMRIFSIILLSTSVCLGAR